MSPWRGVAKRSLKRASRRAGDMHPHGVEDASIALVDVEAVVQKLTEETSGLRDAERVGGAAPESEGRSDSGMPTPHHESRPVRHRRRAAGRAIGDAIPPAWLESAVEVQLGETVRTHHETPALARNDDWPHPRTDHERSGDPSGSRHVRGRIDHRWTARGSSTRNASVTRAVDHDIDADPIVRTGGQHRGRRVDPEQRSGDIELPSDEDQRVAVSHEQPVTEVRVGGRIGALARLD